MGKKILLFLVVAFVGYWAFTSPAEAAGVVSSLAGAVQDGVTKLSDFISSL